MSAFRPDVTTAVDGRPTRVPPSPRPSASGSVVAVRTLSKRFGEIIAVDDVSFSLEAGTVTGFLGPNGAGKTTTL
jgi:ABC-2 type transport system ATP-binding protein